MSNCPFSIQCKRPMTLEPYISFRKGRKINSCNSSRKMLINKMQNTEEFNEKNKERRRKERRLLIERQAEDGSHES